MSISVTITLTNAGANTGPFKLCSNVDSYTTPFESNISRTVLLSGFLSNNTPDGTTIVRVMSDNVNCSSYVDILISGILPTPTPTPTPTATPTPTPNPLDYATINVRGRSIGVSTWISNITIDSYAIDGMNYPVTELIDKSGTITHFNNTSTVIIEIVNPINGSTISITDGDTSTQSTSVTSGTTAYTFNNVWINSTNIIEILYDCYTC